MFMQLSHVRKFLRQQIFYKYFGQIFLIAGTLKLKFKSRESAGKHFIYYI